MSQLKQILLILVFGVILFILLSLGYSAYVYLSGTSSSDLSVEAPEDDDL